MSTTPAPLPETKRFLLRRMIIFLFGLAVLVYLGDTAFYMLRSHFPQLGPASGSIHRIRMLAIPEKNNKVEYQIDTVHPEDDVPCAHSLFSHAGMRPCWYVQRHANDPIAM